IAKMWAVANAQAQYRLAPTRTTMKVGTTMIGQARQNVSSETNQVSPAPRSANANDMLIASAIEKIATQMSNAGTSAAILANSSGPGPPWKIDTNTPGIVMYMVEIRAM